MQHSNTHHSTESSHKILKKPISETTKEGKNIMLYPTETTTWNAEIHSMAYRNKWMRLAATERMLRVAKKNKKTKMPKLNKILETMHIFFALIF